MDEAQTMKVKPWGEGQGEHVVINVSDFNPELHVPFDDAAEPVKPATRTRKAKAAADGADAASE